MLERKQISFADRNRKVLNNILYGKSLTLIKKMEQTKWQENKIDRFFLIFHNRTVSNFWTGKCCPKVINNEEKVCRSLLLDYSEYSVLYRAKRART